MWTKKAMRDVRDLTLTGLTLGISSKVVGDVGGTTAPDVQAGLGRIAKGTKHLGALSAGGLVLDGFSQLAKKYKKY